MYISTDMHYSLPFFLRPLDLAEACRSTVSDFDARKPCEAAPLTHGNDSIAYVSRQKGI